MSRLRSLFSSPWAVRFLGAVLLGLLIWFVGPLVAIADVKPLTPWWARLFGALLPLVVTSIAWFRERRVAAKANADFVDKVDLASMRQAGDRLEIEAKVADALQMLRSSRIGRRGDYLYQLPWYVIIGPGKAGKTTTLLKSGLTFPTAVAGEYRALRGQPNTPNCDWWFTSEAVLIDTAGRYATQDVDEPADAQGWQAFLEILKKHRPLQPLNGILVALPAPDFGNAATMYDHSQKVRARLAEITRTLDQELPIYLMVTKADLLAGFREFFAYCTDAEAEQVFGSTATDAQSDNPQATVEDIMRGFDRLVESVARRMIDRMQQEPQLARRVEIAGFPQQLASLRQPIAGLLGELTKSSRFERPVLIRGVYLTSGTQTGDPIDRILTGFGMAPAVSADTIGDGRSYFMKRLFSDVIFPEAGLAARSPKAERRRRLIYAGGLAAAALALLAATGIWLRAHDHSNKLIDGIASTAKSYAEVAGRPGGQSTPSQHLAALDMLANAGNRLERADIFGLGLDQSSRLARGLGGIYERDLQQRLAPTLARLAEQRMQAPMASPAELYDDLKSYLILGGRGQLLKDHLLGWLPSAWIGASTDADAEIQAANAVRHARAWLDTSFRPVVINQRYIEEARAVLRAQPAAVRVYGRLKTRAMIRSPGLWTARDHAGPQPEIFFAPGGAFAPGAGVPNLFTREGYYKTFLPMLVSGPALLDEERWVVGDAVAQQRLSLSEIARLKRDLEQLYFGEFLRRWNDYLAAMQPRPVGSLPDNIQRLRDVSGVLSPVPRLLRAVAQATDLSRPGKAETMPAGNEARAAAEQAFMKLRMFVGMPAGGPGGGGEASGGTGGAGADGGSAAPMRETLETLGKLADTLNLIAVLPDGGGERGAIATTEARALINQLEQRANQMPPVAASWVEDLGSDAATALGGARRQQIDTAFSRFGADCRRTLDKRFPIHADATRDIALGDFTRFFAPNGAFARFLSQKLAGYIETDGPTWRPTTSAVEVGLSAREASSFQAAQAITRAFFSVDPNQPRFVYQIEPVTLAGAKSVTLSIDGQTLSYDGRVATPATFDWPGSGGAAVAFEGDADSGLVEHRWSGFWAAFRMMEAAQVTMAGSQLVGFGHLASGRARFDFKVRTLGGINPFVVDMLGQVTCPSLAPVLDL